MIKRIVILQDEQLVIREMTRAARPVVAYATAGVGAAHGVIVEDADEPEADNEEPPPMEGRRGGAGGIASAAVSGRPAFSF